MRNFYLTADIDGRKTLLTGGPRAKGGEMSVEIRQRDNGMSVVAFTIRCRERNGSLESEVFDREGHRVATFATAR